jgi:hypothetical protein
MMSQGFKELLEVAINRNIEEIKQPAQAEIRKIIADSIRDLDLVKKSDLESIIRTTIKEFFANKKEVLKRLIKELLEKELAPHRKQEVITLPKPPQPVVTNIKVTEEKTLVIPEPIPKIQPLPPQQFTPITPKSSLEIQTYISSRKFASRNQQFRAIAYFLTKYRNTPHFNVKDLRNGYLEAGLPIHPSFGITARDNVKSGHFLTVQDNKDGFVTWKLSDKTLREFE